MLIGCQLQIIYCQQGGLGGPDSQQVTHHSPCFQAPNSLKARNTETETETDVVYSLHTGFGLFCAERGGGKSKSKGRICIRGATHTPMQKSGDGAG